jgi:hypothetical protein
VAEVAGLVGDVVFEDRTVVREVGGVPEPGVDVVKLFRPEKRTKPDLVKFKFVMITLYVFKALKSEILR